MLSIDLFATPFEKELREGRVDDLEYRRMNDLREKMEYLMQAYKKADTKEAFWDGPCLAAPAVGDRVEADNNVYLVKGRVWQEADYFLGKESAKMWGHGGADLVGVLLFVDEVKQEVTKV